MNSQATERHPGGLNANSRVKVANLKRLYDMGFQLYDILGKARLWRQLEGEWLPAVGREGRNQNTEEFLGQ